MCARNVMNERTGTHQRVERGDRLGQLGDLHALRKRAPSCRARAQAAWWRHESSEQVRQYTT